MNNGANGNGQARAALTGDDLTRYLARIGLDGFEDLPASLSTLMALQVSHVRAVTYENLDIHLGREIRLDLPSLVSKIVDQRRGGYCYEQNTLFAAALEGLGYPVRRYLGRVRLGNATSPRPATHMVLLVNNQVVDVGFGAATPLGPLPLGGTATYGSWTWTTERALSPEGEEVWQVRLFDTVLYTFDDQPRHPVDYQTPNYWSSTHPDSIFAQRPIAQRWEGDVQLALIGPELTERHADGTLTTALVGPADMGPLLHARFDLQLSPTDTARLASLVATTGR